MTLKGLDRQEGFHVSYDGSSILELRIARRSMMAQSMIQAEMVSIVLRLVEGQGQS